MRMEVSSRTPAPEVARDQLESRVPSAGRRLGRNSAVYAVCGLVNKAIGFLLLPIYTHLLTPDQFGVVAVVTVVASFLSALFAVAMGTAVMRYYHEYRAHPDERRAFVGTVLTLVFAVSCVGCGVLALLGERVFAPVLGGVPFWPMMAMGLGVALFTPFLQVYLVVLQTAERPVAYGVAAVSLVLAKTVLAIVLVVGMGWGASGVLMAHLVGASLVFTACALAMRREARVCMVPGHAWRALRYSFPVLPHTLASLVRQILDRMFLVHLLSVAAAGVYHLAFQFGALTQVLCIAGSKAINPVLMRAMHESDGERLANIRNLGTTMVLGYCLFSVGVSLFAPEVVVGLTGPEFHGAYRVVPFIAFTFAASGIYSLLVNTLFYWERMAKYVGLCTVASLGVAVGLNVVLIPVWGTLGAAVAALATQVCFVVAVGWIAHRKSMVRWCYGRFAVMFTVGLVVALWPLAPAHAISLPGFAGKLALFVVVFLLLSTVAYGSPWFLVREMRRLRSQPS